MNDNTKMIFDIAKLVAILNETMTLSPGDVIVSGTPPTCLSHPKPPAVRLSLALRLPE